jgi:putative Holliday junction resolvase
MNARQRSGQPGPVLAISDPSATLATPLETVSLGQALLLDHLADLVHRHHVVAIVIGIPLRPSGELSEIGNLAKTLAVRLQERLRIEVVLWDETLSSWEAGRILEQSADRKRRAGRPPGRGRAGGAGRGAARGEIDRLAAALILQDYLDARERPASAGPTGGH